MIQLQGSVKSDYPSGVEYLHRSVLDVLILNANVETLLLDTPQFLSFRELLQFIYAFPALQHIHCFYQPSWELSNPSFGGAGSKTLARYVKELAAVSLSLVSSAFVTEFFKLFANRCHKLQFTLDNVPSLSYNTGLEHLSVTFVAGSLLSTSSVYNTLLTLFSQIRAPCLKYLYIHVYLQDPDAGAIADLTQDMGMADSISAAVFHAAISRETFGNLRPRTVTLSFKHHARYSPAETQHFHATPLDLSMSEAIKCWAVPLFIPWLSRGAMVLGLPDGSFVVDPPHHSEVPEDDLDNPSGPDVSFLGKANR
ncbi:uncharacterized protein B0H18DRAFT_1125805 [Fomitopsis serialis]|uniref:uncharacterized protein n=1 Tax=Fomitopsis serialis TaxID=139415 RepID=UPI002007D9FC|nr:uncharacterized protein B0H18DRAFT_1125805 [Neoantrodia serialis]KAH9914136.1 hypothetical protein B0H18DRAFT_1125805 [Neoantrodia serialis]